MVFWFTYRFEELDISNSKKKWPFSTIIERQIFNITNQSTANSNTKTIIKNVRIDWFMKLSILVLICRKFTTLAMKLVKPMVLPSPYLEIPYIHINLSIWIFLLSYLIMANFWDIFMSLEMLIGRWLVVGIIVMTMAVVITVAVFSVDTIALYTILLFFYWGQ